MANIPNFILERLYVKGSLQNAPEGCQFSLENHVGTGTVTHFRELQIDDTVYPPGRLTLSTPAGGIRSLGVLLLTSPLRVAAGAKITLCVRGLILDPGPHVLVLRLKTLELGDLEIQVTDTISQAGMTPALREQPALTPAPPLRPVKVAILGAGSTVFARQLMNDLLCTPGLEQGTIALVDVDPQRLELAQRIGEALVERAGRAWTVEATTDRSKVLPGCDYIINTIEVAGLRNVRPDYEIPLKYGVDQCIGDTIGPGGIFKMLRTGPAWLEILRDAEHRCPKAVIMNYTNPMSALTLLALRAVPMPVVGLCHSVQGTLRQLALYLGVPYEELRWQCAGINHMAWFTELTWRGEDMIPRLLEAAHNPEIYEADPVRFEVLLHLGAFVTESSGHFSEYVPYFRKRADLMERYTRAGYRGEPGFYANNWPRWRAEADRAARAQLASSGDVVMQRSSEYASVIVEAIESGQPATIHGNVLNAGLIDNLPQSGCVEVPVRVDATGLHPQPVGSLPPQLAAINAAHMYVHELMVQAVMERDRTAALHALMLDPLTAAVCSLEEIRQMFDELWDAERADLGFFDG